MTKTHNHEFEVRSCPSCGKSSIGVAKYLSETICASCYQRFLIKRDGNQTRLVLFSEADLAIAEMREVKRQRGSIPTIRLGMVFIPAGEFVSLTWRSLEQPGIPKEYLDAFWIDRTPVTNIRYYQFLLENPDYPPPLPDSPSPVTKPYQWKKETQ